MARARSPDRDKAFKLWQESNGKMPLKDIATELGVSDGQVRKWKNIDSWDDKLNGNVTNDVTIGNSNAESVTNEINSNVTNEKKKKGAPIGNKNAVGHGAPLGNKNAAGNRGGHAPPRNTNAVVTGEYQTIWLDMIDDTEKKLINAIDTDPIAQLDEDIRLLTLRERRMLKNLNDLREQDGIMETKKEYGLIKTPKIVNLIDENTGKTERIKTEEREMALVGIEENHKLLIDKILRVEEALTRVQTAKTKAIESKHKIISDNANAAKDTITSEHINIVDDWGKDNA